MRVSERENEREGERVLLTSLSRLFLTCHCVASSLSWKDVLTELESYKSHLEKMGDETLIALRLAEDPQVQGYHKKIDFCRSENNKVTRNSHSLIFI